MESKRVLHFTQGGMKSQMVSIAPDEVGEVVKSKRHHLIEHEDQNLDSNNVELDAGTKARNRAFQEKLDEVWSQTTGWEARLRTEAKEAEESIVAMRAKYQRHVDSFESTLQMELSTAFNRIDNELVPPQVKRIDVIQEGNDDYFQRVIPDAIEQQTGIIAKKLKKQYEAFAIEQQKEKKRELKFVSKANHHIQLTAQKFTDEDALADSCWYSVEDDVVEVERRAARMHVRRWDEAVHGVTEARAVIAAEAEVRTSEDVDLLDTVIETQQLLQKTVLQNFGANPDDAPIPKRGPKLRARLAIAESRRSSRVGLDSAGSEFKGGDLDGEESKSQAGEDGAFEGEEDREES